jgi:mannosyltransferase OCH1-like enzyme
MIPKKIHYCWLSGEDMPEKLQQCVATWKQVMPDYEIVKWDTKKFDIEAVAFVSEAFHARKWAFAADYIRMHALYHEGGIYLDSDALVLKRFDEFLPYGFFTSLEYHYRYVSQQNTLSLLNPDGSSKVPNTRKPGIGLQAAVIAGVKGHPFVKDCLAWYQDKHFVQENGEYFDQTIAPDIYAMIAENYGFKYKDEKQVLRENMLILPSEIFAGCLKEATARSYAIHYSAGTWRDQPKPGLIERKLRTMYEKWTLERLLSRIPAG